MENAHWNSDWNSALFLTLAGSSGSQDGSNVAAWLYMRRWTRLALCPAKLHAELLQMSAAHNCYKGGAHVFVSLVGLQRRRRLRLPRGGNINLQAVTGDAPCSDHLKRGPLPSSQRAIAHSYLSA
jgi:hypothetical protein